MAWADEIARDDAEIVYILRMQGIPRWFFSRGERSGGTQFLTSSWTPPTGITFSDGLGIDDVGVSQISQSLRMFEGATNAGNVTFTLNCVFFVMSRFRLSIDHSLTDEPGFVLP